MKIKATFDNLRETERRLRNGFYNSRNSEFYLETNDGRALADRWDRIMTELRGYGRFAEYGQRYTYKQGWLEYCEQHRYVPYYDMSDVMC